MSAVIESSALQGSIQLSNEWLDELEEMLGTDSETAYGALKGTLHALRDSLTVDEAADLAAQLPMVIRGVYFTGWKPSKVPIRRDATEFVEEVRNLGGLGPESPHPLAASRAVLQLLRSHITEGEIEDVFDQLPLEVTEALDPAADEE